MSYFKKENKNSKLEVVSKEKEIEKADFENIDEYLENNIAIPKSSNSHSNDISKISCSFFSSLDIKENKINNNLPIEKNKLNSVIGIDIGSIFDQESSYQKKLSNLNSINYILNEYKIAEKHLAVENEK